MKKLLILCLSLVACVCILPAQTDDQPVLTQPSSRSVQPQQEFQAYRTGFFLLFDQGATAAWNTRIIKQTGRSNFVFEDFLAGLYVTTRTKNFSSLLPAIPFEVLARVAAYYPLSHTFNDYPQPPINMLNFGVDVFLAPVVQINFGDYAYLDLAAGPHFLYQKADRWHYVHLGIGGMLGVQMPLARRWTLLLNGMTSLDNANLGSNKKMEVYDLAWQYQASLGFRYSKRAPNVKTYIPTKGTDQKDFEVFAAKQEKKSLKAQEKSYFKTLSKEEKQAYKEEQRLKKAQEKADKKARKEAEKAQKAAEKAQKAAEKAANN
jgi:hypothetical protein